MQKIFSENIYLLVKRVTFRNSSCVGNIQIHSYFLLSVFVNVCTFFFCIKENDDKIPPFDFFGVDLI